jgi:hypothetical protein
MLALDPKSRLSVDDVRNGLALTDGQEAKPKAAEGLKVVASNPMLLSAGGRCASIRRASLSRSVPGQKTKSIPEIMKAESFFTITNDG